MKNSTRQANRLAPPLKNQRAGHLPDFEISHHGTLSLFHPLSDRAHKWLRCHCPPNQEHLYLGKTLAIEHRYVNDVTCFALYDGLVQHKPTTK